MEDMTIWLFLVGAPILIFIGWLAQPQCPGCQARGTVSFRHQRKDGGADRRYKDNPASCRRCGWTGY